MATLSLVGMFKNEAKTIRKTLDSVRPYIDRYTIVDTGSEDGTQDIIREVLAGLPGQLVEEPFIGYMKTRNRVLDLDDQAENRADWQLMISGDDILINGGELKKYLDENGAISDCHMLNVVVDGGVALPRGVITKTGGPFRYDDLDCGVHEICVKPGEPEAKYGLSLGVSIDHITSDPDRKLDAIRYTYLPLLSEALERNPENTRAVEGLGKAYGYLMDHEPNEDDRWRFAKEAVATYALRLSMPFKYEEERWSYETRFLEAALELGSFPIEKLLERANALCEQDQTHAEPALLRTVIASRCDGVTNGSIYKYATEAFRRAETIRLSGKITSSQTVSTACEWQGHRFAAIAALGFIGLDPNAEKIARTHISAGLSLGGPWYAFQSIAKQLPDETE